MALSISGLEPSGPGSCRGKIRHGRWRGNSNPQSPTAVDCSQPRLILCFRDKFVSTLTCVVLFVIVSIGSSLGGNIQHEWPHSSTGWRFIGTQRNREETAWGSLGTTHCIKGLRRGALWEGLRAWRAVWELFRSECVFLIDHLMVLKHVSSLYYYRVWYYYDNFNTCEKLWRFKIVNDEVENSFFIVGMMLSVSWSHWRKFKLKVIWCSPNLTNYLETWTNCVW